MRIEREYHVTCKRGHRLKYDVSDIEDVLESKSCDKCGVEIESVSPNSISVECTECLWQQFSTWEDANHWLNFGCAVCQDNLGSNGSVHVVGSFGYAVDNCEQYRLQKDSKELLTTRQDYWDYVVHFCKKDQFRSILEDGAIKASDTGYFGRPAVCLTDTPLMFADHFRSVYGSFGFVFKKRDLLAAGGGPAVYLTDHVIKQQLQPGNGFSETLKPFVNVVRIPETAPTGKKPFVDFMHDREWRYPGDICFDDLMPLGVVIPAESSIRGLVAGSKWKELLQFISQVPEIR